MYPPAFLSLALLITPATARATESSPDVASGIGQMVIGLVVVIAILLASLWLIKRLSAPRGAAVGLKVLGGVAVGSRERVVLVEVADKVLVLGVSSASVSTLHTLDAAEMQRHTGATSPGGDFPGWLKQSMQGRKDAP